MLKHGNESDSSATTHIRHSKLGLLGIVLVGIRFSTGWFGVPPVDGQWTLFQAVTTPVSIVISAIVGVFVTAIFARAYRSLRSDVTDDFL